MWGSENQTRVARWAEETFGVTTMAEKLTKLSEEFDELKQATENDKPWEAADMVIILLQIAEQCGQSLAKRIDDKMKINRSRRWIKNDAGVWRHYP